MLCVAAASVSSFVHSEPNPHPLYLVEKICIADIQKFDRASELRRLLQDQLLRKEFALVDHAQDSDAVLVVKPSMVSTKKWGRVIQIAAVLNSRAGDRLWDMDRSWKKVLGISRQFKTLPEAAEFVVQNLRRDWEKSFRATGGAVEK
jgi:hypothetical protein